jgi:anhydro-N-acetylmuramic acid kinase
VADAARATGVDALVCSGGGVDNPTLMRMLRESVGGLSVRTTQEFGVPTDPKEAIMFAVVGWHTAHGLPGAVPSCTGAREPRVLGAITPGARPLRLPEPLATAPSSLRLEPT